MKNKIIENHGQYEVKFMGHSLNSYMRSYDIIEQISKEQGWTIEETTNRLIGFILGTLQNNDIIHY